MQRREHEEVSPMVQRHEFVARAEPMESDCRIETEFVRPRLEGSLHRVLANNVQHHV